MASSNLINRVSAALLHGQNLNDAEEFFTKKQDAAIDAKNKADIKRYGDLLDDIGAHRAKATRKAEAAAASQTASPAESPLKGAAKK